MTDRAIQSDVQSGDNATANKTPPLNPREAAMREIMKGRLQQFSQESGVEVKPSFAASESADPDADPDDAIAEAERQRLIQTDGRIDTPVVDDDTSVGRQIESADEPLAKKKVKVKIDGREDEVSIEEMQREYQKGKSADRRLDELNRRERELAEREAQLAAQRETPNKTRQQNVDDEPIVDPTVAKQFTAALFDGDEDKAVAGFNAAVQSAVNKAMQGRQTATPDIEEITATVEQRFAVNSALKQSKADYPDMYADPDIEALAAMKIRAKRQNEGLTFVDALESTQEELASKFGWKKSGRQEPTHSTTRDDKLKRKESLDPVVGANVKSTTTETPPLTNSQVIANMARKRPGYGG